GFTSHAFVCNNRVISNGNGSGIGVTNSSFQRFYHNTIVTKNNGTALSVTYNNSQWSDNEWNNNIITCLGTGAAANISNVGTNNTWDYNLYYTSGLTLFSNLTFANWQTGGQDSHSVVVNPNFVNETDLHLTSG